jgi:serine/threonine-protein kinase ATR
VPYNHPNKKTERLTENKAAVRNAFTKAMRVVSTVESATLLTNHAVGTMPDSLSCSQGLLAINQEVEGDEFMRASKRYCRPQPRNGQDGSNTTQQLISKSLKILRFEGSPDLQTLKLAVM